MVSVCLPSDALLQHPPSYLDFSYLRRRVSLHSCSSQAQLLLLTLDEGHLLTTTPPDLEHGVAPIGPWYEKAMAPHSSTLAWKIPWMEEPGGLHSMGSRIARSLTRLINFTFTFHFHALEKEMATYSSVLAWRIPGTGEPGGLPSMGSHRVRHDWSDLAAAAAVFSKSCSQFSHFMFS